VKGVTSQGRVVRRLADWNKDQERLLSQESVVVSAEEVYHDCNKFATTTSGSIPTGKGKRRQAAVSEAAEERPRKEKRADRAQELIAKYLNSAPLLPSAAALESSAGSSFTSIGPSEGRRSLPARRGCSSAYRGVHFDISHQKWRARIRIGGKLLDLGLYDSELNAARKYDSHAALVGRPLNFPTNAVQDSGEEEEEEEKEKEKEKEEKENDEEENEKEKVGEEEEEEEDQAKKKLSNNVEELAVKAKQPDSPYAKEIDDESSQSKKNEIQIDFFKQPKVYTKSVPGLKPFSKSRMKVCGGVAANSHAAAEVYVFAHGSSGWDKDEAAGSASGAKLSDETISSLSKLRSASSIEYKARNKR
jgi:hypothetical protein